MVLVRIRVHPKCSIFVEIAQLDSSVKHWNDTIRFNLTLSELVAVLNKKMWSHNDIAFIDNTKFLKKIQGYPSQELTSTNVNIAKAGIKVVCSG